MDKKEKHTFIKTSFIVSFLLWVLINHLSLNLYCINGHGGRSATPDHENDMGIFTVKEIIAREIDPNVAEPGISNNRVEDAGGRVLNIKKPFKRIISLYGAHTENLFFLGLSDEIIGVSRKERYPEAAKEKPWFSYHDGPEKFLAATPDLVLIRPMIERGYASLIRRLEKSGITVISLQPANVSEMFLYWQTLGILTGKELEARQMIIDFNEKVRALKQMISDIPLSDRKRVYFEAIHSKMKTFTPGSMALFALEVAGGINVATDAVASRGSNIGNYGKEKILSHASEIDVYLAQYGVMNQTSVKQIQLEPGFGIIKAVQENQIFLIDEMIVSRPTFRLLDGIQTIGSILYPHHFNTDHVRPSGKTEDGN